MKMRDFLLLLLLCVLQPPAPATATVRIVEQGARHVRIRYDADGSWEMSARRCLLGIPPGSEIAMRVVSAAPGPIVSGDLDADAAPAIAAAEPAQLGEPGQLRDQRVVNLAFDPVPLSDGQQQVYDQVMVDLEFIGGAFGYAAPGDRWGEELYRGCLLNYEQARGWRVDRPAPAAKRSVREFAGRSLRISLREQGIYQLTGADLANLGIDLGAVDPDCFRILYGGGLPLNVHRSEEASRLREVPIVVEDGDDGRFDEEDRLLFYGESIERWAFLNSRLRYVSNPYTHENVYWLDVDGEETGLRANVRNGSQLVPDPKVPGHYRARIRAEGEEYIHIQTYGINSGYAWYWHAFRGNARNFNPVLRDVVDEPAELRLRLFATPNKWGEFPENRFDIRWNGDTIAEISSTVIPSFGGRYDVTGVREGLNSIGLFHSGHGARLDWYELIYSRRFVAEAGELVFDSPVPTGTGEFRLEGFAERPRVFDFSQGLEEIVDFDYDPEAGTVVFQDESGSVFRRYLVAEPARWKHPVRLELDESTELASPQNGADYVIITHRDFAPAAERLADWRGRDDRFGPPLVSMVVDIRDIYDEFSGGAVDPTAIRNFLTHASDNWSIVPSFVNLFGDGTYDYKNNWGTSHENWIPPFQDGDSTYDEWYVRVSGDDPFPDMAIGRLTVQTLAEAETVVDKLIAYDLQAEAGPWQTRALIVADDLSDPSLPGRLETYFLTDAELLANSFLPGSIDVIKHYLALYPLQGSTKPRARDEFIRLFNEGAVLFTYVGHGNPDVLAHEQMFVMSRDIDLIQNQGRLPFTYLAASQAGVFDDPFRLSMPEVLLSKPDGGVIGIISATRIGHHLSNMILANLFHEQLLMSGRSHVPVGLALLEAKAIANGGRNEESSENMQRYSLIGDPATRLALPRYRVQVDVVDTLRALQEVHIEGEVRGEDDGVADSFSGRALVRAFDSTAITKLDHVSYLRPGSHIFRGIAAVEGGRFRTTFRVPKDITYGGQLGRVSVYAWSDRGSSAFGSSTDLVVSGTDTGIELDATGPEVTLHFVGQQGSGNETVVASDPLLVATLVDESGLNVTGEIGHEIALFVDGNLTTITDGFVNESGDYRVGQVKYRIMDLEPGEHLIRLKAWDSFNNSGEAEVTVRVRESGDSGISSLLFHPNPLTGPDGHFTFDLSKPVATARIRVFALSGRLVDVLQVEPAVGYNQILWAPPFRLANGTYLFDLEIELGAVARRSHASDTGVVQLLR